MKNLSKTTEDRKGACEGCTIKYSNQSETVKSNFCSN